MHPNDVKVKDGRKNKKEYIKEVLYDMLWYCIVS